MTIQLSDVLQEKVNAVTRSRGTSGRSSSCRARQRCGRSPRSRRVMRRRLPPRSPSQTTSQDRLFRGAGCPSRAPGSLVLGGRNVQRRDRAMSRSRQHQRQFGPRAAKSWYPMTGTRMSRSPPSGSAPMRSARQGDANGPRAMRTGHRDPPQCASVDRGSAVWRPAATRRDTAHEGHTDPAEARRMRVSAG